MHQINIGVRPLAKGSNIAKSSVVPSFLDLTIKPDVTQRRITWKQVSASE